jgi:hypothetical protein
VTDLPAGVTIGGNAYAYGLLAMSDWQIGDSPSLEVQLSNVDNAVSLVDLDGSPRGALEGKAATLYEVLWSAAGAQLGEDELLGGAIVVGCVYGGLVAKLTLSHKAVSDAGKVGVYCSRYACPYTFGSPAARALGYGELCGYVGAETWCDHTRARCVVLGNQGRFGAMRIMPTLNSRISYFVATPGASSQRFGITVGAQQPNPTPSPTLTVKSGGAVPPSPALTVKGGGDMPPSPPLIVVGGGEI